MDEHKGLPRLAETQNSETLIRDLPAMRMLIEHHRQASQMKGDAGETRIKACVQVQLWVDEEGHESIVVMGDEEASPLELKGLLHDGVYALAHEGQPGFTVGSKT